MKQISVLIVNQSIPETGVLVNAAFVLGLTVGRILPESSFGPDVIDGDKSRHRFLTNHPHMVRKATESKLRSLRELFSQMSEVDIVDYCDDAKTSSYEEYQAALSKHVGDAIVYRAIHVFGPEEAIHPLTKNLSRL